MHIPLHILTMNAYNILLLLSATVFAVPSCTTTFTNPSTLDTDVHTNNGFPTAVDVQGSVWSRASGRAFDWVWKYIGREEHTQTPFSESIPDGPSSQLLAQYGDQLVLRFNVTTQAEFLSLAEATETLFLDVWNTAVNHVDIRVSRDVVCLRSHSIQLITETYANDYLESYPPC